MDPAELHIDPERIGALCEEYGVARLELFGSVARSDATSSSDVDLLVTFKPEVRIGLQFVALQQALESLFGRSIDLLTRESVEHSPNKYFRHFALRKTELLYECA